VFEPFFTTKGRAATGLGLAAARRAVESLGGTLTATSEVGYGSCFRISLLSYGAVAQGQLPVLCTATRPLRRVLVVGETIADARALGAQIESEDTSTTYAGCEDAIERLGFGETFDLIVWDAQTWDLADYRDRVERIAPEALSRTFAWNVGNHATHLHAAAE
jgi:hypothetical protein